jgi:hypothetical protein
MDTNLYFVFFLLVCCGYAFWRGGSPERAVSAVFLVGVTLTHMAASQAAGRFTSVEAGIFLVDVAALIAFIAVALKAERFWPLWVAAMQAVGTAGHLVKLVDPEIIRWAYAFALAIWSYPMLCLLALGTWRHQQRLARLGSDRAWSRARANSTSRQDGQTITAPPAAAEAER